MAKKQEPRDLSALVDLKDQKKATPARKKAASAEPERKTKTFRVRPQAIRQFGILAKKLDMKEQDLIAEALNMLFEKHKEPPIA